MTELRGEHGWNAQTERDTRLAIRFGYRAHLDDDQDLFFGSRRRVYTVPLPQRNVGLKVCGRVVIAELGYDPEDEFRFPNDANGRERGVISSFGVRML